MSDSVVSAAKIRSHAMDLLTGREFARGELQQKLNKKFEHDPQIISVIDRLIVDGLQSDERYVGAFVRSRVIRGQGLNRIRMEIKNKGIDLFTFDQFIEEQDIDWFELAREVAVRKYGETKAVDQKAKSKRMRFLHYRGFTFDQITFALSVD
ncbi:MAG: regulatory protein RecX [Porticoccaceae bacterium]|nr:regulatory protein RecX [Porticoccaceae bacterium]MDG1474880.1 regulatory protein RecX [Porticoccaceae bacterium]